MKYLLSLCIIAFITALFAESSSAFPTTPSNLTSISNTFTNPSTPPETTAATGEMKLNELCSGTIEHLDLLTTEAMKQAAVKALKQVLANTEQAIDRCFIITPTEDSYLDESIKGFNDSGPREGSTTAFLLVGYGMKSQPIAAREHCAAKEPVMAGGGPGSDSVLPDGWQEHFLVKKTIHLNPRQMLIGVPLDSSNGSFAEGYFAALKKKFVPTYECVPSSYWPWRHASIKKPTFNKEELIHFNGAGILITGLTTLPALNNNFQESVDIYTQCKEGSGKKVFKAYPHDVHTEMLKGMLNLESHEVPANDYMVNIFRNEFFQILKPAISLSFSDESVVDPRSFNNRTLVGFSNNKVYSCYYKASPVETAVDISLVYRDASAPDEYIRAINFKDNHILGNAPKAVNLTLPEHVKVSIANSEFATTKASDVNTKGISIVGPDHSSESWQNPLTVDMTGNSILGYDVALSLTGYQKLVLKSNRLLGWDVSIERLGDLSLPVTLSGDSNNVPGETDACRGLEYTNIIGGFVFSDGSTCPNGFNISTAPPTGTTRPSFTSIDPSSASRDVSEKSSKASYLSSVRDSISPSTSMPASSSQKLYSSIETGTPSSTHSTPSKKRSNRTKDKLSEHGEGNSTRPEHPSIRTLRPHSQSQVYNQSTPVPFELSVGKRIGSASSFPPWQKALVVSGGVLVFGAGMSAIAYYMLKKKRSSQQEPLIKSPSYDSCSASELTELSQL